MASIHKEFFIQADPDHVWDAVRDVGAVHQRLVPGLTIDASLEGEVRTVTFANGVILRELIVSLDDASRRFAYASVGGQATHHNASIQVFSEAEGSRVVWITDVLPHNLSDFVSTLVEQGAQLMIRTLETHSERL